MRPDAVYGEPQAPRLAMNQEPTQRELFNDKKEAFTNIYSPRPSEDYDRMG